MAEETGENKINLDLDFESIVPWNGQQDTGKDVRLKLDRNWRKVVDAFNTLLGYMVTADYQDKKYLRKDQPDTAAGLITFLKGLFSQEDIIIGSDGYAEGLTGFGTKFGKDGSGEMSRLTLRHELRVPSLVFNQTEVNVGDKWRAPGGGCIERVMPDVDAQGNILNTGTFWLKLEKGQIGAVFTNAICMGIFHDWENTDNNATEDSDDSRGNRTYAGFTTSYFTITEISDYTDEEGVTYHRKQCRYQIRPVSDRWSGQAHPYEQMNFVCYGIFSTDKEQLKKYGTSVYETRTYRRMLWNQNTWEIASSNIAYQDGDLSNLNIHGMTMDGYSAYLNSVFFTGTVKQVKPDGTPIRVANECGKWKMNTMYDYYDRVSHKGSLWLCINENGTNTEPKENDPSWLCEVKSGQSINSAGRWNSKNTPYPANSIVNFAQKIWISNKETSNPPFGTYTDKDGSRLTYNDGSYILVDTLIQSDDWYLLLDAPELTNGKDGEGLQARYSSDMSNWHAQYVKGDIWMQMRIGDDSIWSDPILFVGEDGKAGKDGTYHDYQFAVNSSLTDAPTTGWQDTPPSVGIGQYLWIRTRFVNPSSSEENPWVTARIGGEKGEKGDSVSNLGAWKIGMAVPYLGMVTMGGKTFMAKVATNNPPMWCWTDKDGNRFIYSDGGYVLTGEMNTAEYDLVMQNGKDGRDGKDYEYIYIHTKDNSRPSTPTGEQTDDYVPSGWHDDPLGVTETLPYEWVCVRTKKDGIWSAFSKPGIWAKFGMDAILADLDNEMDNVALGADGKTTSKTTIAITAAMYYGSTKQALTAIQVGSVQGITSSYVLSSGVITLVVEKGVTLNERTEVPITLTASINGKTETRTLKFTLAAVKGGADGKDAVLYDIVTSVSSIGKRKDGSYTVSGVSAVRMKTIGDVSTETTDGKLKYSIDGGSETEISNNQTIASDKIGSKIQFVFYNADGVVVDKESVPMVVDGTDGKDGVGINSITITYGKSTSASVMPTSWSNAMPNVGEGEYLWIREVIDYTDPSKEDTVSYTYTYQGKSGQAGTSVSVKSIQYQAGTSPTTAPTGTWSNSMVSVPQGQYLWSKTTFSDGSVAYGVAKQGADGKDGEGFTMMGNWMSGMAVPKMGVVTMGGECFAAKVATTNPPLWCWTDKDGNRLVFSATEYILTGEMNTAEYERWSVKGADGKDGKDGLQGEKGDKGDKGDQGKQGIQGCIIRDSEWVLGTQYRNDENLTSGTRYVDVVLVRNDSATTGWDVYKCRLTHVSSAATAPGNTTYWEEFATNVSSIFTSLIIAKNAKIRFLQGNQLLMQEDDGTVTAGLSGSNEGNATRIWAGSPTPDNAPFRVSKKGKAWMEDAYVKGEIHATSGQFSNVTISGSLRTPWKSLTYKLLYYSSGSLEVWGFDGSAVDDDRIIVYGMSGAELQFAWGNNANGREVWVRVDSTGPIPRSVKIKVPTGYYLIDETGTEISAGNEYTMADGYLYSFIGFADGWFVNNKKILSFIEN